MADEVYGAGRHLAELGLSPTFTLEEAQAAHRDLDERLEVARERQRAIEEQQRKTRQEVARLRGGRVVADHGDDEEEDDIVRMHLNQPNLWRRGPRR